MYNVDIRHHCLASHINKCLISILLPPFLILLMYNLLGFPSFPPFSCFSPKTYEVTPTFHLTSVTPFPWSPSSRPTSATFNPPAGDSGDRRLSCWQCVVGVFISGSVLLHRTVAALSLRQCHRSFTTRFLGACLCRLPEFMMWTTSEGERRMRMCQVARWPEAA